MRWLLCATVWVLANAAGLLVAAETKWGPVLFSLSSRHGVHLGDVLAVLVGLAVAVSVTFAVWLTAPDPPATPVVVAWVLCAAVWELAIVMSMFAAAASDWGPVVMRLPTDKPVPLGDVVWVVIGMGLASVFTLSVWLSTTSPTSIRRRPEPPVPVSAGRGG